MSNSKDNKKAILIDILNRYAKECYEIYRFADEDEEQELYEKLTEQVAKLILNEGAWK
jgi:prephenate dehydrogenase